MAKKTNKKVVENKKDIEELVEIEEIEETDDLEEENVKSKKIERDTFEDEEKDYEELSIEDRLVNMEKKTNTILVLTVIIAILCCITTIVVIGNTTSSDETKTTETTSSDGSYDTSSFKKISGTDIEAESKNETIVVMIGRQGCSWCAEYAPVLASVASNYGFTARYIDLTDIVDINAGTITDSDSYAALLGLSADDEYATFMEENFGGTPLTLIIKNSKIIGAVNGYVDESTLSTTLEAEGFSK